MFKKTNGMSIDDIMKVALHYPPVLCKFNNGSCEVCNVSYECDKNGENVVMVAYPIGQDKRNSGEIVTAYEVLFNKSIRAYYEKNIMDLRKWHGNYTDKTKPENGEKCYILIENRAGRCVAYDIQQAVYNEKSGFVGYSQVPTWLIRGFMHIRENGMVY